MAALPGAPVAFSEVVAVVKLEDRSRLKAQRE
jgi:hypothetical protein